MAKLPWIDMVTLEPCGALLDCKGGLRDYLRDALGDEELAEELARLATRASRALRAPYISRLTAGLEAAMETLGVGRPEAFGRKLVEAANGWMAFPDAARGISIMRDAGYRVVLVSDMESWLLEGLLERHNLRADAVYGGDEGLSRPSAILRAYRDSGVPIWRGLHAGSDLDDDVRPAMVLGLRTAWINRYGEEEPEEGIASEYIVGSLEELAELLAEGDEGRNLDGWLREGGPNP